MNLVEAILASRQPSMLKRTNNIPNQKSGPTFEKVLVKLLDGGLGPVTSGPAEAEGEIKFREGIKFVLEREGARPVREDGGRESSRYGILQSTAAEYGYKGSVRNLSRTEAESIYRKLWDKSGAASLPYPLSTVHFDTYVNSPAAAGKFLQQSQGNAEVYLRLREQRYARLADIKPDQFGKYLKGWTNRIQGLRGVVAQYKQDKSFKA
jgi:lysozyme family protein